MFYVEAMLRFYTLLYLEKELENDGVILIFLSLQNEKFDLFYACEAT